MCKLTAICPPDKTKDVFTLLKNDSLVSNVLSTRAVDSESDKDIMTAFIPRESVDVILKNLRSVRQWEAGELSFIEVDFAVRRDLEKLDVDEQEEEGEDIIGWEVILEMARSESRLTWWYFIFMGCAGLIAAVGLISNLPVLILGAMSLSPDLAPTNAIAVTLTAGAWHRLFRSIRTLILGLVIALTVALISTLILELTGIHDGILKIDEDLASFVTVVNSATVIVALTAGVAAMTAFVTSKATTAVGVAISVTTIPAAAYAGVAIASRSLRDGGAAIIVLVVNILFLTLAQVLTLVIIRVWRKRRRRRVTRS